MNAEEMVALCQKHTMYSWSATGKVSPIPFARAEGIYFYEPSGKRWTDWNSQLMSVNIGHSHPKVVAAMKDAVDRVIFAGPGMATEVRARLGERLARLMPGDINTFFFTLGGAEANENAIKAAKQFTGRSKILARYRSYHGATSGVMQLTGDPRRWPNEPGMPGVVHVMDPRPWSYQFGETDEEITSENLKYLEEVIQFEGPHTIAAMFLETVTGTNGILIPPRGYLQGLRALLSKYGILMVCDEVMAGFGRTGKMMAFEHGNIVPDIVTMAKGLTSSYAPLGAMGVSDKIAAHFQDHVFWGGLTYNAHPFCLEVAMAVLDVMEEERLVEHSAAMGAVMADHMARLRARHPSVRETRNIGLFGIIELGNPTTGERLAGYNQSHPVMAQINKHFRDHGLYALVQGSAFMCNPPLCITPEQLAEAFAIVDAALDLSDAVVA
jgi:taurine--2-oxoglutarate transaminase